MPTPAPLVKDEPVFEMCEWQVFESETGDHHLVGFSTDTGRGRTTSMLIAFDSTKYTARTSSGRIYILAGPAVSSDRADAVWNQWCLVNGVPFSTNVTAEYWDDNDSGRTSASHVER